MVCKINSDKRAEAPKERYIAFSFSTLAKAVDSQAILGRNIQKMTSVPIGIEWKPVLSRINVVFIKLTSIFSKTTSIVTRGHQGDSAWPSIPQLIFLTIVRLPRTSAEMPTSMLIVAKEASFAELLGHRAKVVESDECTVQENGCMSIQTASLRRSLSIQVIFEYTGNKFEQTSMVDCK